MLPRQQHAPDSQPLPSVEPALDLADDEELDDARVLPALDSWDLDGFAIRIPSFPIGRNCGIANVRRSTDTTRTTTEVYRVGGKFDESTKLREQAAANTLEQFLASPDLGTAFMDAVIDSDTNFRNMSEQVLGSTRIQKAILALLARDFYEKHGRGDAA